MSRPVERAQTGVRIEKRILSLGVIHELGRLYRLDLTAEDSGHRPWAALRGPPGW